MFQIARIRLSAQAIASVQETSSLHVEGTHCQSCNSRFVKKLPDLPKMMRDQPPFIPRSGLFIKIHMHHCDITVY